MNPLSAAVEPYLAYAKHAAVLVLVGLGFYAGRRWDAADLARCEARSDANDRALVTANKNTRDTRERLDKIASDQHALVEGSKKDIADAREAGRRMERAAASLPVGKGCQAIAESGDPIADDMAGKWRGVHR